MGLREEIFGKRKKKLKDDDLITIHHNLMLVYGWIPLKDLEDMPMPMLWNLNDKAMEYITKWERYRLIMMKGAGLKNPT